MSYAIIVKCLPHLADAYGELHIRSNRLAFTCRDARISAYVTLRLLDQLVSDGTDRVNAAIRDRQHGHESAPLPNIKFLM